ncbi:MAG: LysR family transcriptional regulator, partial [Phycicoccus sp.]
FDRSARGVSLTAAGSALLPAAEGVLRQADELAQDVARMTRGRPAMRMAVAPELGPWTPHLVAAAARVVGDRDLVPSVLPTGRAVESVVSGRLDLAVTRHPAVVDGCALGEVHSVPRRLLVPVGPADAAIGDLAVPLAGPPRSDHPAAHDQLVDTLRRLGHPGSVVTVGSDLEARALVAAGRACTLVVARDVPSGPWAVLEADELPLRVRVIRRRLGADAGRLAEVAGAVDEAVG